MADGKKGGGTGFLFAVRLEGDTSFPLLITNKHVVAGAAQGCFELHEADTSTAPARPSGDTIPIVLDDFERRWIKHPSPSVDLCALPIGGLLQGARREGKEPLVVFADRSIVPSDEVLETMLAVEDVLMVGYPFGLFDAANSLPIIRRGITASHPAIDHQGKAQGVIDCACFPGSSGSPIYIHNQGAYSNVHGGLIVGHRSLLLGVLWGGPRITRDGEIHIRDVPTAQTVVPVFEQAVHLGYYVKAREVEVLAKHAMALVGTPPAGP